MSQFFLLQIFISYRVDITGAVTRVARLTDSVASMNELIYVGLILCVCLSVCVQSPNEYPGCQSTLHSGILFFTNECWPVWATLSTCVICRHMHMHMHLHWYPLTCTYKLSHINASHFIRLCCTPQVAKQSLSAVLMLYLWFKLSTYIKLNIMSINNGKVKFL